MAKNQPIVPAQLLWNEHQEPRSSVFDDIYFCAHSGLAETDYVFLQANRLAERLATCDDFCLAETGFGTGLNFLAALALWQKVAPPSAKLRFISVEKYPLTLNDLCQAHQGFTELQAQAKALQAAYPSLVPGWHELALYEGRVRLSLWLGEAVSGFEQLDAAGQVDAWFLDGFAPSKNPDMWQKPLFLQVARLSHQETTFATFTAARKVRDGLTEVGFVVHKQKGFGRKRDMCFGHLEGVRPFHSKQPWFSPPKPLPKVKTALVVGAGLAGASVAYALAQAGVKVTVLEAESEGAQGASGNLAGTLHPLITVDWNVRSQFYWQGLQHAWAWLKPWIDSGEVVGQLDGLVEVFATEKMQSRLAQAQQRLPSDDVFQFLSAAELSDKVGQAMALEGVFFPQAGWVQPSSVIKRCLAHPNVTLKTEQIVLNIQSQVDSWQVSTQDRIWRADSLVVATGALDSALNDALGLPIRPVKGQTSFWSSDQGAPTLKLPVIHQGYSVGIANGILTGATFEAPDLSPTASLASHQENYGHFQQVWPEWQADVTRWQAKVAFRPTVPDHLPIIGAVADSNWLQKAYFERSPSGAAYTYSHQVYQPGLYVSNGHGARGLMSVFLAADKIVQQLFGQPETLSFSLQASVHPARYAIKKWRLRR